MKFPSVKYRTQYLTIALGIIMIMVLSCENKLDSISKFDLFVLPSLTGKDIETVLIDSGRLQLVMYAPLVEQYNNTDLPYSEFRSGIRIVFHEGKQETVGTVTAKYAKYTKSNNLWELKDSVVVVNEGNDKLETEVLYWNQEKDLIYTDRFVKITNEDQVIHGFGFESDSRLNNRKIKKVSATIFLNDEE